MTDKEKLARMLEQTIAQIGGFGVPRSDARRMAADLMHNGVTVQDWISVKDRLPIEEVKKYRGETGEDPEFNVMIKGGLVPTSLFFNGEYWYCNFDDSYAVTHWMPLPPPPKGE